VFAMAVTTIDLASRHPSAPTRCTRPSPRGIPNGDGEFVIRDSARARVSNPGPEIGGGRGNTNGHHRSPGETLLVNPLWSHR
jgi:hypothetical protein